MIRRPFTVAMWLVVVVIAIFAVTELGARIHYWKLHDERVAARGGERLAQTAAQRRIAELAAEAEARHARHEAMVRASSQHFCGSERAGGVVPMPPSGRCEGQDASGNDLFWVAVCRADRPPPYCAPR